MTIAGAQACIPMNEYKKLTDERYIERNIYANGYEEGTSKNFSYSLAGNSLYVIFRDSKAQAKFIKLLKGEK